MEQYLPILVLMILAILFGAVSFVATKMLAPKKPTVEKLAPYECGIIPAREPAERFPVKFYLVAMLFIIFDIEIIFLYPWAVEFLNLGTAGYFAILLFSALVFESFVYLIANGALDWGSLQVNEEVSETDSKAMQVAAERDDVRVVGTEGREPVAV